ncbi:MAG: PilZ domain-containing protein [Planctomycetes bacterium]|nr:PilZ domain-containing protein [Planctomycetota bacterium]MCH8216040.1 PilZ domain-containing protein [Planctomycetota bacterium]
MLETLTEQRKDTRTELSWPVSVWVPKANRFFNGKSSNISKTGVFVKMPMTTPLGPGSVVELNFPRTSTLAEQKGQFARIKRGKVVRVDRDSTLEDACIGIGIVFE